MLAAIGAARPDSGPTSWAVVIARPVRGGEILAEADLARLALPVNFLPAEYLSDPRDAAGRAATIGLPKGTVLVPGAILDSRGLAGPGRVVVPVTLVKAAAGLVQVGERLDLFGTDESTAGALVSNVRVVAVPRTQDPAGPLGGMASAAGTLILVEVSPADAGVLAAAADLGPLVFALR